MCSRAIAGLLLLLAFTASNAAAFTIMLDPGSNNSVVTSDACFGTCSNDVDNPIGIPQTSFTSASQGGSSSLINWDLTATGFDFTVSQTAGPQEQESAVSDATIYFSLDEDVDYLVAGTYFHDNASDNSMVLQVQLREASGGPNLFRHVNQSFGSGDVTVDVGTANAGTLDLTGSLGGTLTAGTEYRLFISYRLEDIIFDFSGSEANGTGSLSLGFTPVPEPSSAALLTVGLMMLTARRRRRA